MRVLPFWLSIVVLVGAGCLRAAPAYTQPATYTLKQHIISDNQTDVTIYNAKTGRIVWTRSDYLMPLKAAKERRTRAING